MIMRRDYNDANHFYNQIYKFFAGIRYNGHKRFQDQRLLRGRRSQSRFFRSASVGQLGKLINAERDERPAGIHVSMNIIS